MASRLSPCSESTLTDRYQTTIPEPIRKTLGLSKRDKICYTIQPDGKVLIARVDETEKDPVLGQFLNFIARDMAKNPQQLQAISPDLLSRAQSLIAEVDVDLKTSLSDEDE